MNSVTLHIDKGIIKFSTFIEDDNLYIINNLGLKQILLAKDKRDQFEEKLKELKSFHNTDTEMEKIINTDLIKETDSTESIRIKKKMKPF